MKPGTKLGSATCDTEVMVIRNTAGDVSIECGGAAMSAAPTETNNEPSADFSKGSLMGKRYVDEANTIELLCVKAGKGSLSANGIALQTKDAKPLPSSD